ncbi:MAG: FG-GAP-like repeat-containing protein [bacterium]|nr:FG-GAP-like repeat-containing protein [bacterium]
MATTLVAPSSVTEDRPSSGGWQIPRPDDPRIPFLGILITYAVLGCTVLGFNRNPWQIALTTLTGGLLDMILAWVFRREKIVPLSAMISCTSLSLLLNYSHDYVILFFPVLLTIGSKYVLTFKGRHVFNPSMFGVATSLLLSRDLITTAPAYQWGGSLAMSAFIVMAALSMFAFRIRRTALILSFIGFYLVQTALRAHIMRYHLPPEALFLGTLTSAPFFIFTFYMLTDPQTSPRTPRGQVAFAFVLTLVDLYLHLKESVFTFFYAALIMATGKFLFLHGREILRAGVLSHVKASLLSRQWFGRLATCASLGAGLMGVYRGVLHPYIQVDPPFKLSALPASRTGIDSRMGDLFHQVDPRVQHVAKWLLSVGDAVAVADVDGDGRMDLFLTNPLKQPEDRCVLYRNQGDFRFERLPQPAIAAVTRDPRRFGLASGASFADFDDDGDADLFLAFGYGKSRLFRNMRIETGRTDFRETTSDAGVTGHTMSLGGQWFDFDADGRLDLIVGNSVNPLIPGYSRPTPLNIFDLPRPAYPGDRRMMRFMHNGWHDADNGGEKALYHNLGEGRFEALDVKKMGMPETHWTLAIGTADFNQDGFTDLYLASDFGPDDVYLNHEGKRFERIAGQMFGAIGRDTYKGMNATVADFDRNGYQDVYVSNVHHSLQAEGSLLWMLKAGRDPFHPEWSDEAGTRGVLNEKRFGWGAAAGDLDNDGWVDLVQANGMVDDRLDRNPAYAGHTDYWYVNHKLMQSGPEIHTYADMWGDLRGRTIYPDEPRRVYLNRGPLEQNQFVDVARQVGCDDPENSRAVAFADFDDDGDLDVVITNQFAPPSVYRNDLMARRSWLGIGLIGDGRVTNRQAIGSKVIVSWSDKGRVFRQVQEVHAMNGFGSQDDPRLHFGLGNFRGTVDVTVEWHGGGATVHRGLRLDAYHVLQQPSATVAAR